MDRHCFRRTAVLALVASSASLSAFARDWHVAPGGVDGSPVTVAEPLATLAHAVGRVSSGDVVLVERGGTYFASDLSVGFGVSVGAYGNGARPVVPVGTQFVGLDPPFRLKIPAPIHLHRKASTSSRTDPRATMVQ